MELLPGLASLAALSLFLSAVLRRSSAIMPLVAVSLAMLWFTLFGCLSLLSVGGWAWYGLCAVALVYTVVRHRKRLAALITPGWLFFVGAGLFFTLFFAATQPMLTQWDEFTFWGTAAKATQQSGLLYTLAHSNLIARSYPPALIVINYMVQFFAPTFRELGLMAAFSLVYLAAFAACSAVWKRGLAGAAVFLLGLLALPFFFEAGIPGQMSHAYLVCMADAPMAALFGGALGLYFSGGEKDTKLLLCFLSVLAALVFVKDMGLALALLALMIVAADLFFCQREKISFLRLKTWKGGLLFTGVGLAVCAGGYVGWAAHLAALPAAVNRFDLGSAGQSLSMPAMLLAGLRNLLGFEQDAQFAAILPKMLRALVSEKVCLLGSGAVVFGIIVAVLAATWLLSRSKAARRQVVVFFVAGLLGFAAFYLFNIFTYSFIFKEPEALILKDYLRYIGPYWQGWLMGALVLLVGAAGSGSLLTLKVQAARGLSMALSLVLVASCLLLGSWRANVFFVSPALYCQRRSVQAVVQQAEAEGMRPGDKVYLISQGDDATRFYMLGYEMKADRGFLFEGPLLDEYGAMVTDGVGAPLYKGNAAAALVSPLDTASAYHYPVACTPEQLAAYLRQEGFTHLLVDVPDEYVLEELGSLFSDGLEGWSVEDEQRVGHRYYRVEWPGDDCLLVPEGGGAL